MYFKVGNNLLVSRCLVAFPPENSHQVADLQVVILRTSVLFKRSFGKNSNPSFIVILKIVLVSTSSTGFPHWVYFTNNLTGQDS